MVQPSRVTPSVIESAEAFVKGELAAADASHDYQHIKRVRANARQLASLEQLSPEASAVVDLAALLHDVKDWKYSGSDGATAEAVQVRILPAGKPLSGGVAPSGDALACRGSQGGPRVLRGYHAAVAAYRSASNARSSTLTERLAGAPTWGT